MFASIAIFVLVALVGGMIYDAAKKGAAWLGESGASNTSRVTFGLAILILPKFARDRYNEEWSAEFAEDMTLSVAWMLLRTAFRLRRELERPEHAHPRQSRRQLLAERERLVRAIEMAVQSSYVIADELERLSGVSRRFDPNLDHAVNQLRVMSEGLMYEARMEFPSRRAVAMLAGLGRAVVLPFLWASTIDGTDLEHHAVRLDATLRPLEHDD